VTLLQLALALLTLTVLASLGIPHWFARDEVTLDNAAVLLARDLREVQNRAAFQHRPLTIVLLPDGEGYEVVDDRGQPVRAIIGSGPFRRWYEHDAVFRGVRLRPPDGGTGPFLTYDARGLPETEASLEVCYRGSHRTLTVAPKTGHIEVRGLRRREWVDGGA